MSYLCLSDFAKIHKGHVPNSETFLFSLMSIRQHFVHKGGRISAGPFFRRMFEPLILFRVWASYQIRKIAGCACAGNAGNIFPRRRFQSKSLVSDPSMHHGTCVTHVPWCMSGSLIRSDGENVPSIPGACAPAIIRIWQEAHSYSESIIHHRIQHSTHIIAHHFARFVVSISNNNIASYKYKWTKCNNVVT